MRLFDFFPVAGLRQLLHVQRQGCPHVLVPQKLQERFTNLRVVAQENIQCGITIWVG
jgi:hypothetical protein